MPGLTHVEPTHAVTVTQLRHLLETIERGNADLAAVSLKAMIKRAEHDQMPTGVMCEDEACAYCRNKRMAKLYGRKI